MSRTNRQAIRIWCALGMAVFFNTYASCQLRLMQTVWKSCASTHPGQQTSLGFSKDSLLLQFTPGHQPAQTVPYEQKHDTLLLLGAENGCGAGPCVYKISYLHSGQILVLQALGEPYNNRLKALCDTFNYIPDAYGARRDWLQLDPTLDSVAGISLYKAYGLLKGRAPRPVIVAVIDNGFDTGHEDLERIIWTNAKEKPANGLDDDHNGYTDDRHGWNFRSTPEGRPVPDEQSSATQFYLAWKDKYDHADSGRLDAFEKRQWQIYQSAKQQYIEGSRNKSKDYGDSAFAYNTAYHSGEVIGDSPAKGAFYGSPHITASAALSHGAHVAGIIAAERNNRRGIDGVADNVLIMPVVATTGVGDERDKDVANAIRYAVDNGARIINMSFSKRFSPEKDLVDGAVRYAEQKGVLIIHAAGNDGNDIDTARYYPVPFYDNGGKASNFVTVGWSRPLFDERLAHPYSNYGKNNVDLFAPGSDILSTVPGNGYDYKSGSSMATPVVAGVAALLMSYFPSLTAAQVKDILLKSVFKPGTFVNRPGSKTKVPFGSLSVSGGIVNAYNAVKMAIALETNRP